MGIPKVDDFNTGDNFGSSYFQVISAAAGAGARRALSQTGPNRPNLKLETGARVRRILVEGGRAVGVEYDLGAVRGRARRRGDPVLRRRRLTRPCCKHSGIGPGAMLQGLGIEPSRIARSGRNLQTICSCGRSTRWPAPAPSIWNIRV